MPAVENDRPLDPLRAALSDLVRWLDGRRVPYVVIGGVAASLLGRPRTTQDIDAVVLVDDESWGEFLASGEACGFRPRRADHMRFAVDNRVLLLIHERSGTPIDLSMGALAFEVGMIERARRCDVAGISVALPQTEDLMIMKALARRPKDLADIDALLDADPDIDLRRVRRALGEFSALLETPEIERDFDRLIKDRRARKTPSPGRKRKKRRG